MQLKFSTDTLEGVGVFQPLSREVKLNVKEIPVCGCTNSGIRSIPKACVEICEAFFSRDNQFNVTDRYIDRVLIPNDNITTTPSCPLAQ